MACRIYLQDVAEDTVVGLAKRILKSNPSSMKLLNGVGPSPLFPGFNRQCARLAGICGALALLASAYGAYGLAGSESKYKRIFQMGAHYQLVHAIALLGVPLSKYPTLTTSLFLTGTVMLCGSCYYTSLTRSEKPLKVSSAGALSLLLAWLSFAL
ncbi:hypothetical protein PHET_03289 [Paragonimus heterotremus]|uniref:Transmembrane protein 256 n=1 Tax=Paragonimus heterotremus TaxID=100268 RepID=A0A8J4SRC9_9TREM|nr:hypothetical protein PHET_03289 [Paragonimus heterotremus]